MTSRPRFTLAVALSLGSSVVPGVAEAAWTFYDSLGRIERVEQGSGAAQRTVAYAYSPTSGYLESITDPLNRIVRFERDEAGRVTTQILPDLREIGITYDGNGNVTSVTPPTRPAHDFDYTLFDQLETYTPPEAGFTPRATTYAYNLDGQVTAITRPDGQQIVPTYEPSGRLDYVTIPGGTMDTGYDTAGRVSAISAPGGVSQSFAYAGPLVASMTTAGPVPGSVGFAYNNDFALTSRTVNGGNAVAFAYDDDGLLTLAGALVLSRNAASGFLETTTLGTTSDSRTRTSFAELDAYSAVANGSPVYDFHLDRDRQGRITAKTETIEGVTSFWEYTYHPQRGWLTEVKKDGLVVESYGYDDNGNRTTWDDFWGTGAATYDDQDRMLTAGPRSYTYTNNGELLTKTAGPDVTNYTYDVRGALTAVTLPTGIEITYVIDPGGRRIGKRVNGTLVQGWIYAGGLSPVAETDGAGAITSTFVYATKGNVPDYLIKAGVTYRIFTDHLGSVRLVVNAADGAVAQRIDYDAYGRVMADTNPGFQPFGFAGGIYDTQTDLTRFGARDYDAETGRWTAKDPIGFGGGSAGLFEYSANDPVNFADYSGLWSPGGHDAILKHAFQDLLSPKDITLLQMSSREFDKRTQANELSFMHSMAEVGESPYKAQQRTIDFYYRQLNLARWYANRGARQEALRVLGEALHPAMDSCSPEHTNPEGLPGEWAWYHFPGHGFTDIDFLTNEDKHDLTPAILESQKSVLQAAYRYVFDPQ